MNLHVTSDNLGIYSLVIAKRIKNSIKRDNNKIVSLCLESSVKDDFITYLPTSRRAYENYLNTIDTMDKIIFHPYNYHCISFLKIVKKKFPEVKVYWVLWSAELYNVPPIPYHFHGTFSSGFLKENMQLPEKIRTHKIIGKPISEIFYLLGIKKNYAKKLKQSLGQINFFCSFLLSDFLYYQKFSKNKFTKHLPFVYISLEDIMPGLNNFNSSGNLIMIGHSASPDGNHFEIVQKLHEIDPQFSIFVPLAYGNEKYGDILEKEIIKKFPHAEILRHKLDKIIYHKKLTEVGWAIINVRVQQGLANIIAFIWMGVKVFLDEDSSTFKDFKEWGIIIFSVQRDLNKAELSQKLTDAQIENNKKIIFEKCNEEKVNGYWGNILC